MLYEGTTSSRECQKNNLNIQLHIKKAFPALLMEDCSTKTTQLNYFQCASTRLIIFSWQMLETIFLSVFVNSNLALQKSKSCLKRKLHIVIKALQKHNLLKPQPLLQMVIAAQVGAKKAAQPAQGQLPARLTLHLITTTGLTDKDGKAFSTQAGRCCC